MDNSQYLNPFDNESHSFLVLKNDQGQYSLWPEFATCPQGWRQVLGPASRSECLSYVEHHWKEINPFTKTVTEC
ncbi:MbtH family protein [Marinomonas posidonica]|uniref:MbtH family protein n=1 Tax=Marinomonas posidonica TaxID=936476 RepID=UPI003736DE2E